jgi:hypothetical protein
MLQNTSAALLEILTFWVGPFLLGVEAAQIDQLHRSSEQRFLSNGEDSMDDLVMLDLRSTCGLPSARGKKEKQVLVVDQAGEKVGYEVDQVGDLITVDMSTHVWPLPPVLQVQKRWQQLWGVCRWRDELVLLVDLAYRP